MNLISTFKNTIQSNPSNVNTQQKKTNQAASKLKRPLFVLQLIFLFTLFSLINPQSGNSQALNFDGFDDVSSGPVELIPITGEYTVSIWAKQDVFQPGVVPTLFPKAEFF